MWLTVVVGRESRTDGLSDELALFRAEFEIGSNPSYPCYGYGFLEGTNVSTCTRTLEKPVAFTHGFLVPVTIPTRTPSVRSTAHPTLTESTTHLDCVPFGHLRTTPIVSVSPGWISADHIPLDKTTLTKMNKTAEKKKRQRTHHNH